MPVAARPFSSPPRPISHPAHLSFDPLPVAGVVAAAAAVEPQVGAAAAGSADGGDAPAAGHRDAADAREIQDPSNLLAPPIG